MFLHAILQIRSFFSFLWTKCNESDILFLKTSPMDNRQRMWVQYLNDFMSCAFQSRLSFSCRDFFFFFFLDEEFFPLHLDWFHDDDDDDNKLSLVFNNFRIDYMNLILSEDNYSMVTANCSWSQIFGVDIKGWGGVGGGFHYSNSNFLFVLTVTLGGMLNWNISFENSPKS